MRMVFAVILALCSISVPAKAVVYNFETAGTNENTYQSFGRQYDIVFETPLLADTEINVSNSFLVDHGSAQANTTIRVKNADGIETLVFSGVANHLPLEGLLSDTLLNGQLNLPEGTLALRLILGFNVFGEASLSFTIDLPESVGPSIATPAPEASTWAMLLLGFAGIGFVTYRRRNSEAGVIRS